MKSRQQQGFTLIELMITVAIIGILAGIALPSYERYIVRSNRAAAQGAMMEIANRNQQFFMSNRAYATSLNDLNFTVPSKLGTRYNAPTITTGQFLDSSCEVKTDTGTAPSFVITFAPIATSSQSSDGSLYLSNTGVKCPSGKW